MNTYFFSLVDRVIKICCQKINISNRPPECDAADENLISVLSINSAIKNEGLKDNQDKDNR